MSQLAKLFIRGNLFNVTAKNLTKKEKDRVDEAIDIVWNDKNLQNAKAEFCRALANTIGNEYKDKSVAEEEIRIAIWKACIAVLYHDEKITKDNKHVIIHDPSQRKKFFQTYIFNYLKSILLENKIPSRKRNISVSGPASYVAFLAVKSIIRYYNINPSEGHEPNIFILNGFKTLQWPLALTLDIQKISNSYVKHGVKIEIKQDEVRIYGSENMPIISGKAIELVRINQTSLNRSENDEDQSSLQYKYEFKLIESKSGELSNRNQHTTIQSKDLIETLKKRCPKESVEIVNFITSPLPDSYILKYGKKIRKKAMAQHLGKSLSEIEKHWKVIGLHMHSLGMTSIY